MPFLVQEDVRGLHVAVHDALAMSRRQGGGDLIEDPGARAASSGPAAEQIREAAAAQEAHHEVGGVGLPPVVVQRHDVRVLEPGDELCLALEAPDEVGMIGELGRHRLDRDLATCGCIAR